MRLVRFFIFVILAAGTTAENHGPAAVSDGILFGATKIHRCAVENFMMDHKILYHVTPSRFEVTSLSMLCLDFSQIQTDFVASN